MAFLDLTQQLLALFVLMFGLSQLDIAKLMAVTQEFRSMAGTEPLTSPVKSQFTYWVSTEFKDVNSPGGAVVASVEGTNVLAERVREGVKISIEGDAFFPEGSAEVNARGRAVVQEIVELLRGTYNKVEVRGYTAANTADSVGGDHWLLGYQRALSVSKLLIEGGVAEPRLRIVSGSHNDPIAPNLLPERRGRNRRVEMIVSEELWDPNQ